jgi:hypothetical protein
METDTRYAAVTAADGHRHLLWRLSTTSCVADAVTHCIAVEQPHVQLRVVGVTRQRLRHADVVSPGRGVRRRCLHPVLRCAVHSDLCAHARPRATPARCLSCGVCRRHHYHRIRHCRRHDHHTAAHWQVSSPSHRSPHAVASPGPGGGYSKAGVAKIQLATLQRAQTMRVVRRADKVRGAACLVPPSLSQRSCPLHPLHCIGVAVVASAVDAGEQQHATSTASRRDAQPGRGCVCLC